MRVLTLLLVAAATVASVTCVDKWWESAVVYQIYPRSFKDSDGNGIGDLNGIKEKLPYLKDLGVDAIWLSPIYKSPMYDFGYDIADYKSVSPDYGTLDDFDALVSASRASGIRVVLDFVPNHTSNESEWFTKSIDRVDPYTNYYIWADGIPDSKNTSIINPPSNWLSVFRNSAWEYNAKRKQYYLHQFVIGQPDINYRNAQLQAEMKEVLRFWLKRGVSGFRVDAINFLYEADPTLHGGRYPDEPLSNVTSDPNSYDYLIHSYSKDQNETFDVVYAWRDVLEEFAQNESKIMMTEAYTALDQMMRYYGSATRDGSVPFNFVFLGDLTRNSTAADMKRVIEVWMTNMPAGKTANWVNGNHDNSRLATRHGDKRVDAMNMLALILPGVSITYQGEELGMTDGNISWVDTKDPQACNTGDPENYWKVSRDPARTPFHWDDSTSAGFSTNVSTWLPVASNYQTVNVKAEQAASKSHYKFYKELVALKHTAAVSSGSLATHSITNDVLVVTRVPTSAADTTIVGILNLASTPTILNLTTVAGVPQVMRVVASGVDCALNKWVRVQRATVYMSGTCALVLETSTTTTPAPSGSTTPAPSGSTTPAPSGSTTPAPSGSTTPAPTGSTTAAPGSATTFTAPIILYTVISIIYIWLQ